jgi:hypothetical protein
MVGSVSAYQKVLGGNKKEVRKTQCILDSFFSKILSLESDQPSTSSGETARPDVPSLSSEYDDFLKYFRHCTALINGILIKYTFIKKFATVVVDLCAPRTHPLYFILLYQAGII